MITRDAIQTNLLVSIDVPGYENIAITDYHRDYTHDAVTYRALGTLMGVDDTEDQLRAAPRDVAVTVSGVDPLFIPELLAQQVRGSTVTISRLLSDPTTASPIETPKGVFLGAVSNLEITDDAEFGSDTNTVTVTFNTTSIVELLSNKSTGRTTSPTDFDDDSMNRVNTIAQSNFNFGASE